MFHETKNRFHCYTRGSILLMVLVAIIIMTLTTSSYMLLMRNEHLAARHSGSRLQAELLSQSGIEYLRLFLAQTTAELEQQGGLLNNPDMLQDVLVIDDELDSDRGRFTVVAPDMVEGYYRNFRYGLENESAKLNLNSLIVGEDSPSSSVDALTPRDRLLFIPGMNEEAADAILDWLDEDESPRNFGAESTYYQSLTPAYQTANGPLAHLDELLMIQGVTAELLYGIDTNRNYGVDGEEQPRGVLEELDNHNGQLDRGWSAYLTVHSLEKNASPAGELKIDLNSEDLQTLHGELEQALGAAEANFIVAYRQFGATSGTASGTTSGETTSAESVQPNFEKEAKQPVASLLDLIGVRVSVEGKEKEPAKIIESPWKDDTGSYRQGFADLLDVATVDKSERIAGRININLASLPVLMTIPGMTETLAEQILASRDPTTDLLEGDQRHPIWLIADGLVTLEEIKPMFPQLTTGGDVFSGQVVGFFDAGTTRARARVLLDRSGTQEGYGKQTRLIDWQDLSQLGPGFSRTDLSNLVEPDE